MTPKRLLPEPFPIGPAELHGLPVRWRTILDYYYGLSGQQRLTLAEIGLLLGVSRQAVHAQLHRALDKIERRRNPRG